MAEGGEDQILFNPVCDPGAHIISSECEEVGTEVGDEEQEDCPEERREHLFDRSWRDMAAAVVFAASTLRRVLDQNGCRVVSGGVASPAQVCRRLGTRMLGGALDEDTGNVVNRGPIDQRFDKFRGRTKKS